jgi:uncharacterized membrane protein YfcA
VLFGFISFFIIAWYVENDFLKKAGIPFRLFLAFVGMEIGLLLQPYLHVVVFLVGVGVFLVISIWKMTFDPQGIKELP